VLKAGHETRPFWVTPSGTVFLETTSRHYEAARDFLVSVAEPVSRPDFVHEYRLDKNALFAAASMGMDADVVLSALERLSKVPLAPSVRRFVTAATTGYGKAKVVLRRGRYFVESSYPSALRLLARHPTIRACRVRFTLGGVRYVGSAPPAAAGAGGGAAGGAANVVDLTGDDDASFIVGRALAETDKSLGLEKCCAAVAAAARTRTRLRAARRVRSRATTRTTPRSLPPSRGRSSCTDRRGGAGARTRRRCIHPLLGTTSPTTS
jgi:hypothetical protein